MVARKTYRRKRTSTKRYGRRRNGFNKSYSGYKRKAYRRAGRSGMRRRVALPKYFVAQMNPFDSAGYGVRVPDTNTAPSSAFYTYDEGKIETSVAGRCIAQSFIPSATNYAQGGVQGGSANIWTWNATSWNAGAVTTSKVASVNANYSLCRPVAHAVRLTCNGAASAVTGFIHVALMTVNTTASTPNSSEMPKTLSDMACLPGYRRLTLSSLCENPLIVVNRFLDETGHRYVACVNTYEDDLPTAGSTEGTFNVQYSWMQILVVVESSTVANTIVNYENICHFEGQSRSTGLARDFDAEAPNRPLLEKVSHAVASTECAFYENSSEYAMRVQKSLGLFGVGGGVPFSLNKGGSGYAKPYVGGTRNP